MENIASAMQTSSAPAQDDAVSSVETSASAMQTCSAPALPEAYTLEELKDSARCKKRAVHEARHNIQSAAQQRKEEMRKFFRNISGTGLWFNANRAMAMIDANLWALTSAA